MRKQTLEVIIMGRHEHYATLALLLLCTLTAASNVTKVADDILKNLSWTVKLKIFKDTLNSDISSTVKTTPSPATYPMTQWNSIILPKKQTSELPLTVNATAAADLQKGGRRVGFQALRVARQGEDPGAAPTTTQSLQDDDNDMRLKLFRLMYETVRDSDLKVKRAELIKDHYTNSTAFEIGYLIGDITDKSTIIQDISMTLKKFEREWRPIEHINAYEQIANQAIEITHLIDMVRVVSKKDGESQL